VTEAGGPQAPRFVGLVSVALIGAVGYSQLSFFLTVDLLGLPLYFPEPFVLLLFGVLYFGTSRDVRPKVTVPLVLVLWGALTLWWYLILLGSLEGPLIDALATGRPFLYALFAAFVSPWLRRIPVGYIFWFLVGIVLGELLNVIVVAPYFDEQYRGIVAVNIAAVSLLSSMVVYSGRRSWWILATPCLISISVLSGFRVVLFALVLSIVTSIGIRALRSRGAGALARGASRTLALVFLIGAVATVLVKYVLDVHEFAYFRTVDRTVRLLSGDVAGSQDGGRLGKMAYYLTEEIGGILPSGFVMRARDEVGNFNDVPLLNFTVTFGVPLGVSLVLLIVFAGALFGLRKTFDRQATIQDMMAMSFFPVFVLLIIVNGRFAYVVYESVLVGLVVGYWVWSALFWRPGSRCGG